uniref:C2H2-type domain-containing protein n=1 Tax=Biomphalaria glabrata TaxID=6526 RepID=A0A2C9K938_BIOGL
MKETEPNPTDILENKVQNPTDFKSSDYSNVPLDFKQELAHFSELNGRYEETNKMFICHLCDFRTAFRNSLLNHQAVHSDLRPWICSMCDYAAKRKQDLKKHLHTIHGMMVESTMLRPIGMNLNISGSSKSLSREESSEDNSCDNDKNKGVGMVDPGMYYPHINTDSPSVIVKQEIQDKVSHPSCQANLPSMSNFVKKKQRDSPDLDLPLSFPSITFAKTLGNSHTEFAKDSNNGEDYPFQAEHFPATNSSALSARDKSSSETFSSNFSQKPNRKRPHSSVSEGQAGLQESTHPSDRPAPSLSKTNDSDEHHPCSSSSAASSSHNKEGQTQATFLCDHCDIMFFQRAMYLMHIGLHSPEDPWCCAVCGGTFTEKYSFTSHFINQH